MHAVIRSYSGQDAKPLFDLLERRKADVEQLMRSVPGFQAYTLMRTADGGVSVTVCADKAGTDASLEAAAGWIGKNAGDLKAGAPTITEGTVFLQLG